jgi:hypothetical protein
MEGNLMQKVWDIKHPAQVLKERIEARKIAACRRYVNKFFDKLETRGGITPDGKMAVLFVYNEEAPEKSYILTEQL